MANKGTSYITNPSGIPVVADGSSESRSLGVRTSDVVNVKDFGAVGDGVADDYTSIQSAVSLAESLGGKAVHVPAGVYALSSPLRISKSLKMFGDGFGSTQPQASFPGTPATSLVGRHSGSIVVIKSATEGEYLHTGSFEGILLDGEGASSIGLQAQSTRDYYFDFACTSCVDIGFLISNGNNALSANNQIGRYLYDSSARSSCEESIGLSIVEADATLNGQGTTRTCATYLRCVGGKNGAGVSIGDHDAGYFARVDVGVKSGGTGRPFVFRGVSSTQPRPSRKNVIGMLNGDIYGEAGSRNAVLMINSEPSSVHLEDDAVIDYSVIDRNNGSRFQTFKYKMADTVDFGVGSLVVSGTSPDFTGGGGYPTIPLPDASTSKIGASCRIPRDWAEGQVPSVRIPYWTSSSGDVTLKVTVGIRQEGEGLGNVSFSDTTSYTIPSGGVSELHVEVSAPDVLPADNILMCVVERLGEDAGDSMPSSLHVLGLSLDYVSYGPYTDGGKTWDSPVDVQ